MEKDPSQTQPLYPPLKSDIPHYQHGHLTKQIIGCAIEVHRRLGPGFLESIYEEAFSLELDKNKIPHDRQKPIHIYYDDAIIGVHRIDVIVDKKIVVELKAVRQIEDVHLAICSSYLKACDLHVGLLINFSEAKTRVRRVYRPID